MSTGRESPVRQLEMTDETRRIIRPKGRRRQRPRTGDARSYFDCAADSSQVIPEGQRRRLLALGKVDVEPNLVAQGSASTHALGLTGFGVADRLREREDIR